MKRIYAIAFFSALAVIIGVYIININFIKNETEKVLKVGFVYVGDASTSYTNNFIKAQTAVDDKYRDRVETIAKFNIAEGSEKEALQELVDAGCGLIFTTSFAYGAEAKQFAERYPNIQFCQATCSNANEEPKINNYHTFMGAIYQGRYVSGIAAGMKLQELIENGIITAEQAKIGYVGAYPYAEVISGYTAFFLGIRSIIPEAKMTVKYTNTWTDYALEKKCAKQLIDEGCIIISQHSDTTGPAVACEETDRSQIVYHIGYNQSMADVAPTTYLIGSKINWTPYILGAVDAVFSDKKIEKCVQGNVNGNDIGAGFEEDWVQMLELNETIVAEGTKNTIDNTIKKFKKGQIQVFKGDYIGINPDDKTDTYDLNKGYIENENCSAPTFYYILRDAITIE